MPSPSSQAIALHKGMRAKQARQNDGVNRQFKVLKSRAIAGENFANTDRQAHVPQSAT